jgi:hypothetical protein
MQRFPSSSSTFFSSTTTTRAGVVDDNDDNLVIDITGAINNDGGLFQIMPDRLRSNVTVFINNIKPLAEQVCKTVS